MYDLPVYDLIAEFLSSQMEDPEGLFSILDDVDMASRECSSLFQVSLGSLSEGTKKVYRSNVTQFRRWIQEAGIPDVFPYPPSAVALFLIEYSRRPKMSSSSICSMGSSIRWMHEIIGRRSPTDSLMVENVLKSLKRTLAKPLERKLAILREHYHAIIDTLEQDDSLKNLRLICMIVLATHGFIRIGSLLAIRIEHFQFETDHFSIFLPKCKNDQYRHGQTRLINKSKVQKYCPYRILKKYLAKASIDLKGSEYIFRNIVNSQGQGTQLVKVNKSLLYSRARDHLIEKLKSLGLEKENIGWHSFRSGAASACSNKGLNLKMIKQQGGWKTDSAMHMYLDHDVENRLKVSKCLGEW